MNQSNSDPRNTYKQDTTSTVPDVSVDERRIQLGLENPVRKEYIKTSKTFEKKHTDF